jgi:DNA-binding response OmpR family regulator
MGMLTDHTGAQVRPGATVLIVDDHVALARGFAMALESAGYVTSTANTAEDGLRLAVEQTPDAIILDLRMPFINGVGFLYRLRMSPPHATTPVLVLTGAGVNDETRSELAELKAVLRFKPLGLNELIDEVSSLLRDRSKP